MAGTSVSLSRFSWMLNEYTGIEDDDHYMTATPFGTGYTFTEIGGGSHGDQLYGPVESVLAVRTSRPPAYA